MRYMQDGLSPKASIALMFWIFLIVGWVYFSVSTDNMPAMYHPQPYRLCIPIP